MFPPEHSSSSWDSSIAPRTYDYPEPALARISHEPRLGVAAIPRSAGWHAHPLRARSASAVAKASARQAAQAHPFGAGSRLHGLATAIHETSGLGRLHGTRSTASCFRRLSEVSSLNFREEPFLFAEYATAIFLSVEIQFL